MEIKCPFCGSTDFEVFDTIGGCGDNLEELCACFDCDETFRIVYKFDCIKKV